MQPLLLPRLSLLLDADARAPLELRSAGSSKGSEGGSFAAETVDAVASGLSTLSLAGARAGTAVGTAAGTTATLEPLQFLCTVARGAARLLAVWAADQDSLPAAPHAAASASAGAAAAAAALFTLPAVLPLLIGLPPPPLPQPLELPAGPVLAGEDATVAAAAKAWRELERDPLLLLVPALLQLTTEPAALGSFLAYV